MATPVLIDSEQPNVDENEEKYRCCCKRSNVKSGTFIIAIFTAIGTGFLLIRCGYSVGVATTDHDYSQWAAYYIVPLLLNILGMFALLCLFFGWYMENCYLLLPFLIIKVLDILSLVAQEIMMAVLIAKGGEGLRRIVEESTFLENVTQSFITTFVTFFFIILTIAMFLHIWFFTIVFRCYHFFRDKHQFYVQFGGPPQRFRVPQFLTTLLYGAHVLDPEPPPSQYRAHLYQQPQARVEAAEEPDTETMNTDVSLTIDATSSKLLAHNEKPILPVCCIMTAPVAIGSQHPYFDEYADKYKCCCKASNVKTGTLIVAILSAIGTGFLLIINGSSVGDATGSHAVVYSILPLLLNVLGVLGVICLFFGWFKENCYLLVPFLIMKGLNLVSLIAQGIMMVGLVAKYGEALREFFAEYTHGLNVNVTAFVTLFFVLLIIAMFFDIWFFTIVFGCYHLFRDKHQFYVQYGGPPQQYGRPPQQYGVPVQVYPQPPAYHEHIYQQPQVYPSTPDPGTTKI